MSKGTDKHGLQMNHFELSSLKFHKFYSEVLLINVVFFFVFFFRIPFTIQRLCELLTDPKRNYTGIDKFLLGLEKVNTILCYYV